MPHPGPDTSPFRPDPRLIEHRTGYERRLDAALTALFGLVAFVTIAWLTAVVVGR